MTKKENQDYQRKNTVPNTMPDTMPEPDPKTLKDDPAGETVCSPHFSQGCINEDTDPPPIIEEEEENEEN